MSAEGANENPDDRSDKDDEEGEEEIRGRWVALDTYPEHYNKENTPLTTEKQEDDSSNVSPEKDQQDPSEASPRKARDDTQEEEEEGKDSSHVFRSRHEPLSMPPTAAPRKRKDSNESSCGTPKGTSDLRPSSPNDPSSPKSPRVGHSAISTEGQNIGSSGTKGSGSPSKATQKSSIPVKQFDIQWPADTEGADNGGACGGGGDGGGVSVSPDGARVGGHDVRSLGKRATGWSLRTGSTRQPHKLMQRTPPARSAGDARYPCPDAWDEIERAVSAEERKPLRFIRMYLMWEERVNPKNRQISCTSLPDRQADFRRSNQRPGRSELNIQGWAVRRASAAQDQAESQSQDQVKPQAQDQTNTQSVAKRQCDSQAQSQPLGKVGEPEQPVAEVVSPPSEVQLEIQGQAVTQLLRRQTVQQQVSQAAAATAAESLGPTTFSEDDEEETAAAAAAAAAKSLGPATLSEDDEEETAAAAAATAAAKSLGPATFSEDDEEETAAAATAAAKSLGPATFSEDEGETAATVEREQSPEDQEGRTPYSPVLYYLFIHGKASIGSDRTLYIYTGGRQHPISSITVTDEHIASYKMIESRNWQTHSHRHSSSSVSGDKTTMTTQTVQGSSSGSVDDSRPGISSSTTAKKDEQPDEQSAGSSCTSEQAQATGFNSQGQLPTSQKDTFKASVSLGKVRAVDATNCAGSSSGTGSLASSGQPSEHPLSKPRPPLSSGSSAFSRLQPLPPTVQSQSAHDQSSEQGAAASSASPAQAVSPSLPSSSVPATAHSSPPVSFSSLAVLPPISMQSYSSSHSAIRPVPSNPALFPPSSDSNPPLPPHPPPPQTALKSAFPTDDSSSPPPLPDQNQPPSHTPSEESD